MNKRKNDPINEPGDTCPPKFSQEPRAKAAPAALAKCFLGTLILAGVSSTALAQYSINWFKVSGGGGTSSGGAYTLGSTIGQQDAGGALQGGNFSLTGGFWLLYAVQSLGAPTLGITLTSTNTILVSWPSPSTGFGLQQNDSLTTTNWTTPPQTVNDNGAIKFIVVNPPTGNRFYRLQHP